MEKKGSRSVQTSAKGIATDSKKNQDVSSGKPWPRNGRRREPAGSSLSAKNETSRKPIPQRTKTMDKRPKPRGTYYSGAVGGKEDTRLEQCEAELGSVFVQGSKKQSLNHLLNFYYTPREGQSTSGRLTSNSKSGHRGFNTQKHKYNKEQFLQANCQFIVNASGDYKQYMNDPDSLVDWDLIEQVNVQVSEFPSCPICLYPPVAAKMTRCGHIYCWPCMLHYLSLSDKTWRKCPICYEAVHNKDLKSVVVVVHPPFNINDQVTFKLMKRARGSLFAYPADQNIQEQGTLFNLSEIDASNVYSKLLIANTSEVIAIVEREHRELVSELQEDDNCPEKCFIEQAIALLKEREHFVIGQIGTVAIGNVNELVDDSSLKKLSVDDLGFEQLKIADGMCADAAVVKADDEKGAATVLHETENFQTDVPAKYFYFYQASDGQHLYLHALNVRMLEHMYGSLEHSPKTLVGRIIEKEGGSMTEELRKRLRYLQHLPVTCQFEVAEIQLKQPVICKETLEHFNDQIEIRRKRRQRRAREEKRREKRINEEENKKMGKYPVADIHIESHNQFPDFGLEPVVGRLRTESECTTRSERSLSPVSLGSSRTNEANSLPGSLSNESECSGISFAKMLSTTKRKTIAWPELKNPVPTAQPAKLINVTGAKPIRAFPRVSNKSESESDQDGYVPAPTFNQSFGDAIAEALEKASKSTDTVECEASGGGTKKKKKKCKQKVLFATTMAYSGN